MLVVVIAASACAGRSEHKESDGSGGMPSTGGTGGMPTAGSGTSASGAGSGDTNMQCTELGQEYSDAYTRALACTTDTECQNVVRSLLCSCESYVADRSELDAIQSQWSAAQCYESLALKCPACATLGAPACINGACQ